MKRKPYKAKNLSGAQAEVRRCHRRIAALTAMWEREHNQRNQLARLAAEGPAFSNPLDAWEAEIVRDAVLAEMGMKPDGSRP